MSARHGDDEEFERWLRVKWGELQTKFGAEAIARLWLAVAPLAGTRPMVPPDNHQRPYSFYMPGLENHGGGQQGKGLKEAEIWDSETRSAPEPAARAVYSRQQFKAVQILEESFADIRNEAISLQSRILALKGAQRPREQGASQGSTEKPSKAGFVEYDGDGRPEDKGPMTSAGYWDVFYFVHEFQAQPDNIRLCPKTARVLLRLVESGELLGGMVCFSRLQAGTRIIPHTGPSNMRLTCHLGLLGCEGARLRAHDTWLPFEEGRCFVFDDSFEHEVVHTGLETRVTLMLDLWHPQVTAAERQAFMELAAEAVPRFGGDRFFYAIVRDRKRSNGDTF
jgi:aspartyl/asparaginyl beta-hydroxylase (cupin superfamily)